tara:strand:+ start:1631 stop:3052 length:1422 start_codon:yes stop_codon:yes gene_type:complete
MTYVGATPTTGDFKKLDSITTSSATTFNLRQGGVAVYPQSANHCIVSLNGVIQAPVDAFTIVNDTIVFSSSLAGTDVINFILVLGNVNDIGVVSDDTISTAKLQANSVTYPKTSGLVRPNSKNLLINSDMAVAQRGASATGKTASGYYTCDRWNLSISSAGTWTQTQESLTSGDAHADGFSKSLKMDNTTADGSLGSGDYNQITYKFEGQDLQLLKKGTSNAKKVTVGFWIKATKTGTNILEFYDNTNSRQVSQSYTVSSSNTWEYKVVNFPADTTGSLTNNNAQQAVLVFWLGAGSNFSSGTLNTSWASATNANRAVGQVNHADSTSNNWEITGVQMEVGEYTSSTLPPFQHESYQENYDRCLRYYYRITPSSGFRYVGWCQMDNDDTNHVAYIDFKKNMRSAPSALEQSGTASHYKIREASTTTCDAVPTFNNADIWYSAVSFKKSSSGFSQGEVNKAGIDGGYLGWSAEL